MYGNIMGAIRKKKIMIYSHQRASSNPSTHHLGRELLLEEGKLNGGVVVEAFPGPFQPSFQPLIEVHYHSHPRPPENQRPESDRCRAKPLRSRKRFQHLTSLFQMRYQFLLPTLEKGAGREGLHAVRILVNVVADDVDFAHTWMIKNSARRSSKKSLSIPMDPISCPVPPDVVVQVSNHLKKLGLYLPFRKVIILHLCVNRSKSGWSPHL